jgi:hypothetical protein
MAVDVLDLARRHKALAEERQSWEPDWVSCAKQLLPRKCRILERDNTQTNRGGLRTDIVDSTGIYSMRDLAAGMHGGMTSPARPWFRLGLQDEMLEKRSAVRDWLDEVQTRMYSLLHRSNFYNAVHHTYEELGTFGTSFLFELPDERTGIRFTPLTAGEYVLDIDENGRVDTIFRTMELTPRQLVRKFGYEKMPSYIQTEFTTPPLTITRHKVVHAIFPREDRKPGRLDGRNKPWASVYWLEPANTRGGVNDLNGSGYILLSESGFDEMPGFGPRWDVTGQDVYGRSPGMDVLPDCRMLQQMVITTLKAMHKEVDPPMVMQGAQKNMDLMPGGQTFVDGNVQGQAVYQAMQIRPNLANALQYAQAVQNKIKEGLFNNLFRLLMNSDRRQITAKEVAAREEEKLILIGPVLERLHDELFIPLVDRTFNLMVTQDLLPPWPQEIQGMPIKVEFVSLLAQAQKMVATSGVDQYMGFIGTYAQAFPELLDAVHPDNVADGYASYLGIEADMIRPQEDRDKIRQGRQQAIQAQKSQAALEQAQAAAGTAKTLADTPMGTGQDAPSALQALMSGLGTNPVPQR